MASKEAGFAAMAGAELDGRYCPPGGQYHKRGLERSTEEDHKEKSVPSRTIAACARKKEERSGLMACAQRSSRGRAGDEMDH